MTLFPEGASEGLRVNIGGEPAYFLEFNNLPIPSDILRSDTDNLSKFSGSNSYNVDLIFDGTPSYEWAFLSAKKRLEQVITSDLPDVFIEYHEVRDLIYGELIDTITDQQIDDIKVYVSITEIDGPGGILGGANPTLFASTESGYPVPGASGLPIIGQMVFDRADLSALEQQGTLQDTILHEMIHAVGGGPIHWQANGLQGFEGTSGFYWYSNYHPIWDTSTLAHIAYDSLFTSAFPDIPLEFNGGSGTAGGHWYEGRFDNELMTGWVNYGDRGNPLSIISLGMLGDIGYGVDFNYADAFHFPSNASFYPPIIQSNGGGDAARIKFLQSNGTVAQVNATDLDNDRVTYQIARGEDAGRFFIDVSTGLIEVFESEELKTTLDADANGVYEFVVRATDGYNYDRQSLFIDTNFYVGQEDSDSETPGAQAYGSHQIHAKTSGGYAVSTAGFDQDADPQTEVPIDLVDARGVVVSSSRSTLTHAEADPDGGFWVLDETRGRYSVRHFDDDGKEDARSVLLRSPTELPDWEDEFAADLNGDDRLGPGYVGQEDSDSETPGAQAYGSHQIHAKTSGGYAVSTAGFDQDADPQTEVPIDLVDARGVVVSSSRSTLTHAEADPDGGFWVLDETRGRYSVRHFDDDGKEDARSVLLRSPTELPDWEDEFAADLNGDDRLGPGYVGQEDSDSETPGAQAYGSHQIHAKTSGGYAVSTAGFDQDADPQTEVPIDLVDARGVVVSSSRSTLTHAEADPDGGFWVLDETRGRYSVRHFDDDGKEDARSVLLRSPTELPDWEDEFAADLNGDDRLGPGYVGQEDSDSETPGAQAYGSHQIHAKTSGGYAVSTAGFDQDADPQTEVPIDLVDARGVVVSSSRSTLTHAEADPDGGFWVLDETRGRYSVRHFDDDGKEDARSVLLRSPTELPDWEDEFAADLNGDDRLGPGYVGQEDSDSETPGAQAYGSHQIHAKTSGGYAVSTAGFDQDADPQTEVPIDLVDARGVVVSSSRSTLTHAEADPDGGFWVLDETRGRYSVRHFDDDGKEDARSVLLRSPTELPDWEDEFAADLNGDDRLGHNEFDPVFTSEASLTVSENQVDTGYIPSATDADGDPVTFSIVGGADGDKFELDGSSGELKFKSAPNFENPTDASSPADNVYEVQIEARDGKGGTASQTVSITVTDVAENQAPVFASGTTASFAENGTGTVYTAVATDADGDTPTYHLIGGSDQALFDIDSSSGALTFKSAPDYETPTDASSPSDNVYEVQIEARDGNGGTSTRNLTINVLDVSAKGLKVYSSQIGNGFGFSVSGGVDVNKDEHDDIIIGAPYRNNDYLSSGSAFIILGNDDFSEVNFEIGDNNAIIISGSEDYHRLGAHVSGGGDIDEDGFEDIVLAAGNGPHSAAESFLIAGKSLNFSNEKKVTDFTGSNIIKFQEFSGMSAISGNGDFNNDGMQDWLFSSQNSKVFLIDGKIVNLGGDIALEDLNQTNSISVSSQISDNHFGSDVSFLGDFNNDGFDDFIIGTPFQHAEEFYSVGGDIYYGVGQSTVIFGNNNFPNGDIDDFQILDANQGFSITSDLTLSYSGFSVSAAGDINNDGFDDLIIGGYLGSPGQNHTSGGAYVIFGTDSEISTEFELGSLDGANGFALAGTNANDYTGFSVSAAGDINNDGFDDLVIGAPGRLYKNSDKGKGYVIYGKSSPFDAILELSELDKEDGFWITGRDLSAGQRLGFSVAAAGDINNDGYGDVIFGAPGAGRSSLGGEAYVIFGQAEFDEYVDLSSLEALV